MACFEYYQAKVILVLLCFGEIIFLSKQQDLFKENVQSVLVIGFYLHNSIDETNIISSGVFHINILTVKHAIEYITTIIFTLRGFTVWSKFKPKKNALSKAHSFIIEAVVFQSAHVL